MKGKKNRMNAATPYSGPEPFVFISYSHRNREEVFAVIEYLCETGFRVWYDEGIAPGAEWDENIAFHVEECDGFISFISHGYLESDNCRDELNYAREKGKQLLLVYLEDVRLPSGMAMRLNRRQAIHKHRYGYEEDFYRKLEETPMLKRNRNYMEEDEYRDFEKKTKKYIGKYWFSEIELIGTGFAGKVYKAYDERLKIYYAMKQYSLPDAFHISFFTRVDLARRLLRLCAPGLCQVYDIYLGDEPCIIMAYIEGEALDSYLGSHTVSIQRGLEIVRDVLLALEELHRYDIYYGDLKPDNIMVSKSGRVCLCDFSESNFNGFQYDEITTVVDKFKSPEREPGNRIDFRSDIYECGMLLDELTLKMIDIGGHFTAQINEEKRGTGEDIQDFFVKQQILKIIKKAVKFRPEDRFPSAANMREQVEKLLTE